MPTEPTRLDGLNGLAQEIARFLHVARDDLSRVRLAMQALLDAVEREERRPSPGDLVRIGESLQECLRGPKHPMDRMGVATAVGYLAESPYWMEWWGTDSRGNLEFVGHSLNPERDNFYDYSARSWFSIPQNFGTAAVIGPYVDFGGINSYTYTVTISVPVVTARGFAGVAGADILADKFERFLLGGRDQEPVVLANADLRVIASNTSAHLPGDLLQADDLASWTRLDLVSELFTPGRSWQLATPAP